MMAIAAVRSLPDGVLWLDPGDATQSGDVAMKATIVGIYTTAVAGAPLQSVPQATLETGKGIVGDRYYDGAGTFSTRVTRSDAQITLIEIEEIERFNDVERSAYSPGAFRRNIVTSGIRLNNLAGKRFRLGSAVLEGKRLCEPCGHLARLVSNSVVEGMAHRAGLRAQILTGATIGVGDEIVEELGL
jgi:hypothetical protein